MVRRLTLLLVLLSLAGGVLAGTPLHAGSNRMMDCCDKAKSKDKSPEAEIARLCCETNCSTSAPTSSITSFNFAPSSFTVTGSIAEQIAALFADRKTPSADRLSYTREVLARTFQPRYIQYHSFLI